MVFCNMKIKLERENDDVVTILILIDGFLQSIFQMRNKTLIIIVTILILIDGFLQ